MCSGDRAGKLTERNILDIRILGATGEYTIVGLAQLFITSESVIRSIMKYETYKHITREMVSKASLSLPERAFIHAHRTKGRRLRRLGNLTTMRHHYQYRAWTAEELAEAYGYTVEYIRTILFEIVELKIFHRESKTEIRSSSNVINLWTWVEEKRKTAI